MLNLALNSIDKHYKLPNKESIIYVSHLCIMIMDVIVYSLICFHKKMCYSTVLKMNIKFYLMQ